MTKLIPNTNSAASAAVLDSHQAADALRQALNYPYDVQGFDDLLNAVGANRSNYMQAAHQQKLINAVSSGNWAVVTPRVNPDNGAAHGMGSRPNLNHPGATSGRRSRLHAAQTGGVGVSHY
ncbi:hypothetical protein [Pseudomonas sp. 31-12]|uniref:hypothetical protein n=1 Tax=Pseudomonas sp. 31-12 TaxID=2201356 RepID=UPI0013A5787A|nr:hypothetical protein [Pseudomonas sp. 31-12]